MLRPLTIVATGSGGISETVTVTASGGTMNVSECAVMTTIETRRIEDFPLQGRSVQSLALLAPGTTSAAQGQPALASQTAVSANGQRPNANMFLIDGVSANFGITPGGINPGISAAGGTPALTASGGANGLASQSATEEVTVRNDRFTAEYGRGSGAQISVVTKAGTNQFHGSLFQYFGNNSVDASDWFANSRGLKQPARRLNNFGGTLGGPVSRDHIFFFLSYEGLRLRQPMTAITDVPSLSSRVAAPSGMQPFLKAFPIPTSAARPDGFAEFAASFANPARHDVGSLRT